MRANWAIIKTVLFVAFATLCCITSPARAVNIQEVISPGGIKAWLVEDHAVPLLAMNFAFNGGSVNDAPGKEGTGQFITGMMDEGAGDLDGPSFRDLRDRLSISIRFSNATEQFYGEMYSLSKNRKAAFSLLQKAVTAPRFASEPLERMRKEYLQQAADALKDPGSIAGNAWSNIAFPRHPYGRSMSGTLTSIAAVTADDLRGFHKAVFSRKGLKIAVVGDIDAKSLGQELDTVFGSLPDVAVPDVTPFTEVQGGATTKVIDYDSPQSIILLGGKGLTNSKNTAYAPYLLSEIVGGRATFARLNQEVREKRGLTYGISFSLNSLNKAGYSMGYLATANETAGEALKVTKAVLKDIADNGPTAEELALAKTYLTGAYALRFDSDSSIASNLLAIQLQDYPITHMLTRNDKVNAVTLEQVKAYAKQLLEPDQMIVVVVGKPVGIEK